MSKMIAASRFASIFAPSSAVPCSLYGQFYVRVYSHDDVLLNLHICFSQYSAGVSLLHICFLHINLHILLLFHSLNYHPPRLFDKFHCFR